MSHQPAPQHRRRFWLALPLIVLLGCLPLLVAFAATSVANFNGCAFDEGGAHSCLILGHDWGEPLYNILVDGWMMLFTLPLGALLLLLWFIALLTRTFWLRHGESTVMTGESPKSNKVIAKPFPPSQISAADIRSTTSKHSEHEAHT